MSIVKNMWLLFFTLSASQTLSQQTPVFSQYFVNPYLYNPAMAGKGENTQAFFLYRNQWAGIDGAPETQVFTLDGRLENHPLGFGLAAFNDINNVIGRTSLGLTTSYEIKLSDTQYLAFGISGQAIQNKIFFDRIRADDETDPTLLTSLDQKTAFELNIGLNYTNEKFQIGLAADQVLQNEITFEDASRFKALDYNFIRHYIGNIRYKFPLSSSLKFEPMVLARIIQGLPSQFDVGLTAAYKDQVTLGVTYRSEIAMAYFVGFEIQKQAIIGYTYEVPTSDLNLFGSSSHEFMIGWRFKKTKTLENTPTPKTKSLIRLEEENAKQYQKIDELHQRNERNRLALEESRRRQDKQHDELAQLRQEISQYQRELEALIRHSSVDPDSTQDNTRGAFYLVIGASKTIGSAKDFQTVMKRDWDTDTRIIQNNSGSFYLIYTQKFETMSEALVALAAIKNSAMAAPISGNPWIFRQKKSGDE